ncbi:hypothetical protein V5799_026055 [Amblyomma americanum]|uniref:Uncharacterized protein n=1 Tax=Amblyomma americanum TaxID=6943 RepID=A0AAQ4DJN7_AMBAM
MTVNGGVRLRLAFRKQETAAVGSHIASDELWPKQETLLIIQVCEEFKENLRSQQTTRKQICEMLAARINEPILSATRHHQHSAEPNQGKPKHRWQGCTR